MVVTERLPQHLQRKHKLKREDPKYNKLLSLAKVVSNKRPHVFLRMKEERNRTMNLESSNSSFIAEDKELTINFDSSGDESVLSFQGPNWEDERDGSDAPPSENDLPEISTHATTKT